MDGKSGGRLGMDEQREMEENDILKNYQGSLAKQERKKKSGGFQSMGTFIQNKPEYFNILSN